VNRAIRAEKFPWIDVIFVFGRRLAQPGSDRARSAGKSVVLG
jgi:hypothetical protein